MADAEPPREPDPAITLWRGVVRHEDPVEGDPASEGDRGARLPGEGVQDQGFGVPGEQGWRAFGRVAGPRAPSEDGIGGPEGW